MGPARRRPGRLVSFELHRRMLDRHIRPGFRVLEIGPGPGRFSLELARLGATIIAADISPVQLRLHEQTMRAAGVEHVVTDRVVCDVRDVSRWRPGDFDAVVVYGGPISYAFDDAERATAGLLSLVDHGGIVLGSVMSLLGSWRLFMPGIVREIAGGGATMQDMRTVWETGDTRHQPGQVHICRLFRAQEVTEMINAGGGEVLEMSASGWGVHCGADVLEPVTGDPQLWKQFLDLEERSGATPGALDGSSHILFAARSRPR